MSYGISSTRYALDNALTIVQNCLDVFSDGVQLKDSFSLIGIGKDFYDIAGAYSEVKKEIADLTPKELETLLEAYTEKAILLFWNNKKDNNYYGIEAIKALTDEVFKLYVIIIDHVKDGIDIDDINAVPAIKDVVKNLIKNAPEAKKEMDDLNATEIALIVSELGLRLFTLYK